MMLRLRLARTLALLTPALALAACAGDAAPTDGGMTPADGGPPESCGADTECPASNPSVGGACEGTLSCDYGEPGGIEDVWRYDCMGGGWAATNVYCGHDGICIPPLIESCNSPFTGTVPGAVVELGGPNGGFRAFGPMESVPVVIGPQGGVMLQARVRVSAASPPVCAELESTLTVNGTTGVPLTQPIALRCGLSQPFYLILPVSCGEAAMHDVTVRAVVTGAGETTSVLRVTGGEGPCPR